MPYAAFKLMRILRGYELPGAAWKGYRLVGDTLWSPEGLAFRADEQRWWSLTVLMARQFRTIMEGRRIESAASVARASLDAPPPSLADVAEAVLTSGVGPANAPGPRPPKTSPVQLHPGDPPSRGTSRTSAYGSST